MAQTKTIEVKPIKINTAKFRIVGDGELILNKMNAVTERELMDKQKNKSKDTREKNMWEELITAIRWRDGDPEVFTEESFRDALMNNAPCISGFGLKKSFGQAIVRNEIDRYATKFDNTVNVVETNIPITFTTHRVEEKLMSPKKGSPVLTRQNIFSGWSAEFTIRYVDNGTYSLEMIAQVISLAGFGGGIGSGRSSGYGRYHIEGITA